VRQHRPVLDDGVVGHEGLQYPLEQEALANAFWAPQHHNLLSGAPRVLDEVGDPVYGKHVAVLVAPTHNVAQVGIQEGRYDGPFGNWQLLDCESTPGVEDAGFDLSFWFEDCLVERAALRRLPPHLHDISMGRVEIQERVEGEFAERETVSCRI